MTHISSQSLPSPAKGDHISPNQTRLKRTVIFAYGVLAYLMFLVVFSYMAGFLLSFLVPKGINTATPDNMSLGAALTINIGLIALFGFFHSLLARDHVKSVLLNVLPQAAERSTYVVQSSLCLALAMWQWQALPGTI